MPTQQEMVLIREIYLLSTVLCTPDVILDRLDMLVHHQHLHTIAHTNIHIMMLRCHYTSLDVISLLHLRVCDKVQAHMAY